MVEVCKGTYLSSVEQIPKWASTADVAAARKEGFADQQEKIVGAKKWASSAATCPINHELASELIFADPVIGHGPFKRLRVDRTCCIRIAAWKQKSNKNFKNLQIAAIRQRWTSINDSSPSGRLAE